MPVSTWDDIDDFAENPSALDFIPKKFNEQKLDFFRKCDDLEVDEANVVDKANAILNGEFCLFSQHRKKLGLPPEWHKNVMTGEVCDKTLHWAKIADFGHGDIKCVWEINRFPWAFDLARAYARTGQEKYAETYWQMFEDWLDENPPNLGVNWKCGQEATFRLVATCFARRAFAGAKATTVQRLLRWRKFVAFTGKRIAGNLDYALSQNNNHGISECIGLITVARIMPSIPSARKFLELGKKNLIKQLQSLVYPDGAFSQHSTVYHRVVLHALAWYLAIEKSLGKAPDEKIFLAAERALKFLLNITDLKTGFAPLHGPNDGANILPLTNCDYLDFRPAIKLLARILGYKVNIGFAAYEEALLWFSLVDNKEENLLVSGISPDKVCSGWFMFHGPDSRMFVYSPEKFLHRPAQADLLHADLWWKGIPVTRDPGSFSYNSEGQFSGMFKSTRVHNTVSVNDEDQMHKLSRFLFLPWPKAKVNWLPNDKLFTATHNAYKDRGYLHTRKIWQNGSDRWVVEDFLQNCNEKNTPATIVLHWLLADFDYSLDESERAIILYTPQGDFKIKVCVDSEVVDFKLVRAAPDSDCGWWSPYYYYAEPALSLTLKVKTAENVKFVSYFQPVC